MKSFIAATALVLAAGTASADTITLTAPGAGATLHESEIAMSVYWTQAGDAQEVVATYVTDTAPAEPARLNMHLADGDSVSFGVPGVADRLFTFARVGSTVSVESARVSVDYASR